MKIKRNIPLIYVVEGLNGLMFWVPIWVLFYLNYTDYAGIGLLESVMMITAVLGEVPSGALADLLGKKKTLILAYFLSASGNILMGMAPDFNTLATGVMLATIGWVMGSGTKEAFVYDTLITLKQKSLYEKIMGNLSSIKMIAVAIASLAGGYLFYISPGFPSIFSGVASLMAMVVAWFFIEPPIDTEVFSLKNYLKQTKQGVGELFKTKNIAIISALVIAVRSIAVMNIEVLVDTQIINRGWQETQLGWIYTLMFLVAAGIGQLTDPLVKKFGKLGANFISATMIGLTMILVPFWGMSLATIIIITRSGFITVLENTTSAIINKNTQSKYRATTISTYNMLANIPYALTAFAIGLAMDLWPVDTMVMWFGLALLGILGVGKMVVKNNIKYK